MLVIIIQSTVHWQGTVQTSHKKICLLLLRDCSLRLDVTEGNRMSTHVKDYGEEEAE